VVWLQDTLPSAVKGVVFSKLFDTLCFNWSAEVKLMPLVKGVYTLAFWEHYCCMRRACSFPISKIQAVYLEPENLVSPCASPFDFMELDL